ncbi:hypothetical protein [Rubricoccus marinus]|uniref:Uncharacterized protein n=1 Tax=Rubricoccus marinus TaxID=716817 RepID=A0A259TV17_9BACT|nr:hypothetical protein [Rubricoccus marinus]OZC01612.1 hypothetical protein BSZ36_00610 [Rubricoccus marinus]
MEWEKVQLAFEWDGSWRDIYVLDSSLDDWQRLLDFLRTSRYNLTFKRASVEPIPVHAAEAFGGPDDVRPLLQIDVDGIVVNSHFFAKEEIEFDLDPREVEVSADAEAVFEFMAGIGRALSKPVILTPENMSELALIAYDPATDELQKLREFGGLL